MDISDEAPAAPSGGPRGARQHRYMESTDINALFRALFGPLRTNIRRGMGIEGQLYAIEMDPCVPGELLRTTWIPPASRGIGDRGQLADPAVRRAVFDRLLEERRPQALFAYVCECAVTGGPSQLYVEVVSADAAYAAVYPVWQGRGWHQRDLLHVEHYRLGPMARA